MRFKESIMKNPLLKYPLFMLLFCSVSSIHAQLVNNAYFLENYNQRHIFNPSFQPFSNFYLGIPVISNWQFQVQSDLPTLQQSGFNKNQLIQLSNDKPQILNALGSSHVLNAQLQVPLMEFGFRWNKNYWTFSLAQKMQFESTLGKSAYEVFFNGLDLNSVLNTDFSNSLIHLKHYSEVALGYSRRVSNRFQWGTKLKLLYGHQRYELNTGVVNLTSNTQEVHATGELQLTQSSPYRIANNFSFISPGTLRGYLQPNGLGASLDVGITYKPIKPVTVALAVTDIGSFWWRNLEKSNYSVDFHFNQQNAADWLQSNPGFTQVPSDTIFSKLRNHFVVDRQALAPQNLLLSPTLNASVEIAMLYQFLNLGILSRTTYNNGLLLENLTASMSLRPATWLNIAFTYSLLYTGENAFGLGVSTRIGSLQMFASADYVPQDYASIQLKEYHPRLPNLRFPVGYNTDRFSIKAGVNYVLGQKRDADKDGVSDRFDRCPDTPLGVRVDRFGCPVDSDGDGVPDYLDACPFTPREARGFVGVDGCLLDSDGDGVPDYLDKCSNSSPEAAGFVDKQGCPIDSDGDGVPDYLDRCDRTPAGVEVDEHGCPIDSDGDSVPDYLDLCVNTPTAAIGYVDVNGCPVDSDDDGVLDYLDLCPNTPIEARGFVDANGCLVDADDDNVSDYLDQCLNTAFEARGTVNERGCPRDSDGDSVPDYLDDCPQVPGLSSNRGCPEIAQHVKSVLLRAIQQIRFHRDTLQLLPSSYPILDEIVLIMKENPLFYLEIQGHTDHLPRRELLLNRGVNLEITPSMNMEQQNSVVKRQLSEEYAKLVRNYLFLQGVSFNRLYVTGKSDTRPIATNQTEAGRIRNTRVELFIRFQEIDIDKE